MGATASGINPSAFRFLSEPIAFGAIGRRWRAPGRGGIFMDRHPSSQVIHLASSMAAEYDDAHMIAALRAHDERAMAHLYKVYSPRLTGFLSNLIHRPQMVEEVIDDTMMVIWTKPESFRGACKLSTWIFAIAYRKALKAIRRRDEPVDATNVATLANDREDPESQLSRERTGRILSAAVGQLKVDHRTVIDLAYYQGKNYEAIAEIMACPLNTVKTRMFHARRELRKLLSGDLSEWL
jgi:RNA polymerase sigma factor (sigma-70 family)